MAYSMEKQHMETDLFSIVIPCRNEEKLIGETLQSIKNQTVVDGKTCIIIADANSTDNTLKIVQRYRPGMNIRIIKGGLPPTGRNNGARYCYAKYILFMDADVKLGSNNTLEKVIGLAEKKQLDLVIPQIKIERSGPRDKIFEYLYFIAAKSKLLGAFGTGMFICIKNDAFRRLGPFNENLPLGDDWELTHKVRRSRFALADTSVYTSNRRFNNLGYFSTFYMWASVALSKRYRDKGHFEYFHDYDKVHHETNLPVSR
jgi:glycosyltransferase involved in cell wall biosynthesis